MSVQNTTSPAAIPSPPAAIAPVPSEDIVARKVSRPESCEVDLKLIAQCPFFQFDTCVSILVLAAEQRLEC